MSDCIFCKIVSGEIPVKPIKENPGAILIADKNPMAPVHVIAITRTHMANMNELMDRYGRYLWSDIMMLLHDYAMESSLKNDGYRIIINTGKDVGQTVQHLHVHLLGGAVLKNDFGA